MDTEDSRLPPPDLEKLKYVYMCSCILDCRSMFQRLLQLSLQFWIKYLKNKGCGTGRSTPPFICRRNCSCREEHCMEGFWFYREKWKWTHHFGRCSCFWHRRYRYSPLHHHTVLFSWILYMRRAGIMLTYSPRKWGRPMVAMKKDLLSQGHLDPLKDNQELHGI